MGSEDRFFRWPVLVVEVISKSTAVCDRGPKFALYRKIETLRKYLVIDYTTLCVESLRKNAEGLWVLHDYTGVEAMELASISTRVSLAVIFEDLAVGETD